MKKISSIYPHRFKKILVLGSGALKIGEAGEFDYSGSQAIKALKEEKIKTILVNPNIATNQTSEDLADKIYFLPVDSHFVTEIIKKERPDGVLLSFGGQTALNCGVRLFKAGVFKKYGVVVLGTSVESIENTEDRQKFKREMEKINLKVPESKACQTIEHGVQAAQAIGYPVIIRAAFTLGGQGSGFASNPKELQRLLESAFSYSPQVLIEEDLRGWKEVEYEVVRDYDDNCVTVCNMENFDPLGIHTGESIVVAPSQTLTNDEYHKLRALSQHAIRHLNIIGECNIQFALNAKSEDYRVIEVNARLSRSSALASKATGYPLAHVAAKLALGYSLPELRNSITKKTTACFEPALDYLALKIPRWDLDKFRKVSFQITSEMKSVGEIMALGRSFEEVIQKGLRMLQIGLVGLVGNERLGIKPEKLSNEIKMPTPKRILAIAEALKRNMSIDKINTLSGIDKWFLGKLKNIIQTEKELKKEKLTKEILLKAKKHGFCDKQIALAQEKQVFEITMLRKQWNISPSIRQIDTMAGEFPAQTNYLYLTYHTQKDDVDFASKKPKMIVLGSGPYSIGSSVEFDWCGVNALKTLAQQNYETIMVNYNPETVSTDYDMCQKLYFDELSFETVMEIYHKEKPQSILIATGGQIPNNLALKLHKAGVSIVGTSPENIDRAEDRNKFSTMLDNLNIDQPRWKEFSKIDDAFKFAKDVGYPVLVRPSYVLSGAAMSVAHNQQSLKNYLDKATEISPEAPVVISKFEQGAKEIEIDAIAQHGNLVISAIAEHIEHAGVHSGDATIVLPPQKLYIETIRRIKTITKKIAAELDISGPFNIQFLAKNNQIKVIECNLRTSRSFPFSSKVTGYNFVDLAIKAMVGRLSEEESDPRQYHTLELDHVGVKAPQFSFSRLRGADPVLGVEMASTGEVACFGDDLHEAFLKAMISVGFHLPHKNILLSIGRIEDKASFLSSAKKLISLNYRLFATEGTSHFLKEHGIKTTMLCKASTQRKPNLIDYLKQGKLDFVINVPKNYSHEEVTDGYIIRRTAIDLNVPLVTNLQVAKLVVECLERKTSATLQIKQWKSYL